jgi:hypothetical protein
MALAHIASLVSNAEAAVALGTLRPTPANIRFPLTGESSNHVRMALSSNVAARPSRRCNQALAAELHLGTLVGILVLRLVRFEMKGRRHVTTPFSSVTDRPRPRAKSPMTPSARGRLLHCKSPALRLLTRHPRGIGSTVPTPEDATSLLSDRPDRTFRGGGV